MIEDIEDGKIKKIIRQIYDKSNTKGINMVMDELEAVIKPVIKELRQQVKDVEQDLEDCRDALACAENEANGLQAEIDGMEYAKVVERMLEQFNSY